MSRWRLTIEVDFDFDKFNPYMAGNMERVCRDGIYKVSTMIANINKKKADGVHHAFRKMDNFVLFNGNDGVGLVRIDKIHIPKTTSYNRSMLE